LDSGLPLLMMAMMVSIAFVFVLLSLFVIEAAPFFVQRFGHGGFP
jgi:hypothetical protein